jgi:hypothetical protein
MSMRFGNIDAAIASWWGPNQKSEQLRVPALLAGAARVDPTFRIALYYEKEGSGDPTIDELRGDLGYITREYAGQPNYLRIDGRPVLFVYDANDTDCAVVDRWLASVCSRGVDKRGCHPFCFIRSIQYFTGFCPCPRLKRAGGRSAVSGPRRSPMDPGHPQHDSRGIPLATHHFLQRVGRRDGR